MQTAQNNRDNGIESHLGNTILDPLEQIPDREHNTRSNNGGVRSTLDNVVIHAGNAISSAGHKIGKAGQQIGAAYHYLADAASLTASVGTALVRHPQRLFLTGALAAVIAVYSSSSLPIPANAEPPPELKYRISFPLISMNYNPNIPPTPIPSIDGRTYALSIGLPPEIADQFSSIPVVGTNERALIGETKIVAGKYSGVFKNRPDINRGYISNGRVSDEALAKYGDLDLDGIANRTELLRATSLFNPCDKDPLNSSKRYVIVLSGGQVGYNSRTNESPIESGPTLFYLMFRDIGIPDSDIYFFLQKRASAVALGSHPYPELLRINLRDEGRVRQILADAWLIDNPVPSNIYFEMSVEQWRRGEAIVSDDLLTKFGPVEIDYLNREVTYENLKNVFAEIRGKVKPTDEIYLFRANHGAVDPIEGYSPPGRGFFGMGNFGWGGSGALYHFDINEFLSGINYCRAIDIQVSSHAGALGKDIFLNSNLEVSPVGGPTLFISGSDPFNNFWIGTQMPARMYGKLKDNPHLSMQQLFDSIQLWQDVPQYTNTNSPNMKSQFFFYPSAR